MPVCFAYGSNMDAAAMEARCPASRPLGLARLSGFRVAIMREGYATVVADGASETLGLLWDVALADMPALDRYEAVASGLYRKMLLPVLAATGNRRALVYVGRNAGPGRPRPGYLEGVLAAARAAGLPEPYCRRLASLGPGGGPRPGVAPLPPPVAPLVRPTRRTPLDPARERQPSGWRWTP